MATIKRGRLESPMTSGDLRRAKRDRRYVYLATHADAERFADAVGRDVVVVTAVSDQCSIVCLPATCARYDITVEEGSQ